MAEEKIVKALLYAPAEPDATQKKRFTDFIVKKYGEDNEVKAYILSLVK